MSTFRRKWCWGTEPLCAADSTCRANNSTPSNGTKVSNRIHIHLSTRLSIHPSIHPSVRGVPTWNVWIIQSYFLGGKEFFRFVLKDSPPSQTFRVPGIKVNVSYSPIIWFIWVPFSFWIQLANCCTAIITYHHSSFGLVRIQLNLMSWICYWLMLSSFSPTQLFITFHNFLRKCSFSDCQMNMNIWVWVSFFCVPWSLIIIIIHWLLFIPYSRFIISSRV